MRRLGRSTTWLNLLADDIDAKLVRAPIEYALAPLLHIVAGIVAFGSLRLSLVSFLLIDVFLRCRLEQA